MATLALLVQEVQTELCEHVGWQKLDQAAVDTLADADMKRYAFCTIDCDYTVVKQHILNVILNINQDRHSVIFYPASIEILCSFDNPGQLQVVVCCFSSNSS